MTPLIPGLPMNAVLKRPEQRPGQRADRQHEHRHTDDETPRSVHRSARRRLWAELRQAGGEPSGKRSVSIGSGSRGAGGGPNWLGRSGSAAGGINGRVWVCAGAGRVLYRSGDFVRRQGRRRLRGGFAAGGISGMGSAPSTGPLTASTAAMRAEDRDRSAARDARIPHRDSHSSMLSRGSAP